MKENELKEEKEELLNDSKESQNENKNLEVEKTVSKNIDLNIYDYTTKKIENYKFINEEDDILLCKEENILKIKDQKENKEAEIQIKELYQDEENEQIYCLNKTEIKNKLLKATDLEQDYEEKINQTENEMNKLYRKTQLKHLRKIINGEIKKYPFFEWTGFFCCNKKEYLSLGLGFITYFNTLKLLILFFFLISLINSVALHNYLKYNSELTKDSTLLKSTLANTMVTYLKAKLVNSSDSIQSFDLDCSETKINISDNVYNYNGTLGNIIAIKRYYGVNQTEKENIDYIIDNSSIFFDNKITDNLTFQTGVYHDSYSIEIFNNYIALNCNKSTKCENISYTRNILNSEIKNKNINYDSQKILDLFFYSCITNNSNYDIYNYEAKNTALYTSLVTLILVIIFYITYKKSVSSDKKLYKKNKIFINDYTLVLHDLNINSDDFNEDLSNLISFLNNIIERSNYLFAPNEIKAYSELSNINIFDISISHVNEKKIKTFKEIKSLQNKITDIKNDKDTIKNKMKSNIKGIFNSVHNIIDNLKNKEDNEENNKTNIDSSNNIIIENKTENDIKESLKIKKIKTNQFKIKEKIHEITIEIEKLHKESKLNHYTDIYITFRNQIISRFIYEIYKKNKLTRFFYYIFCQSNKLKPYYYKNQWLKFRLADDNPSDIQWENCYILTRNKWIRRTISFIVSFAFILAIIAVIVGLNQIKNQTVASFLITLVIQVVKIASNFLLKYMTKFEKYSSQSKNIFWDISKYYWINFPITGLAIQFRRLFPINQIFTYEDNLSYHNVISTVLTQMIISIFTSQLSSIFSYILRLLKRFADSKYQNGRTTKLTEKKEYENLYLGPEFPLSKRYSEIFVNFSICLLYGVYSPSIYYFFLLYLIVTFIIDKYLVINFYRKPPLYGDFTTRRALHYWMWGVFICIYSIVYHISNPNLFNYEALKESLSMEPSLFEKIFFYIYYILFPISLFDILIIYFLFNKLFKIGAHDINYSFLYFNFRPILLIHFIIFIFFLEPISIIKKIVLPKVNSLSFLNSSPIEIGTVYSFKDLKKYYEIKKLELFNLIISIDNKGKKKKNIHI